MTLFVTIGEVVGFAVLVFGVLVALVIGIGTGWRQARCKHERGIHETMACDAICLHCNKNLGFIGSQQNQQRVREHTNRPTGRKQA